LIFYSPTGADHFDLPQKSFVKEIPKVCYINESLKLVFWCDQHDKAVRNKTLSQLFSEKEWQLLKNRRNTYLMFFFPDEYYNWYNIREWAEPLKKYNIPTNKILIVCTDKNFEHWTIKTLRDEFGITNFNIMSTNFLLHKALDSAKNYLKENANVDPLPTKKFSVFSRNYQLWRLEFYYKLWKNNILPESYFTFQNIMPYHWDLDGKNLTVPVDSIIEDYSKIIKGKPLSGFLKWLENLPYKAEDDTLYRTEKYNNFVWDMLKNANIHICIESHYDPLEKRYIQWPGIEDMTAERLSATFITEKVFKPILLKKPFIIVSTPNFFVDFKKLGFKSFSPLINERYDSKLDNATRMRYISKEIYRINRLSAAEMNLLIDKCKPIAEHNYIVATKIAKATVNHRKCLEWLQKVLGDLS